MSGGRKSLAAVWQDTVRRDSTDLDRTSKLVGYVLSTYFDGQCQTVRTPPSRATLAAGASISDRAVDKALVRLEQAGFLTIDPPARLRVYEANGTVGGERSVCVRPGGNNRPNRYVGCLPASANAVRTAEWDGASQVRTATPPSANGTPPSANAVRTKALKALESDADRARSAFSGARSACKECGLGRGNHIDGCPAANAKAKAR